MKTEIQLIPSRKDDNIGQLQLFQRIIQTLLILLVFDSMYLFITHKKYNVTKNPVNWYSAGISWFIIAYMLSIQLSQSLLESFVYGLVLGLAILITPICLPKPVSILPTVAGFKLGD